MYAVIFSGGKQYPVKPGEVIRLEKLPAAVGETVEFEQVALIAGDDGQVSVGAPFVEGGRVRGEVAAHGRGDKVRVIKFRRRKNYRRLQGHRQAYTDVKIADILNSVSSERTDGS
ncbi:MAG: 50S ribosomal protein L21 [Gammaproteobacteria bacterium]